MTVESGETDDNGGGGGGGDDDDDEDHYDDECLYLALRVLHVQLGVPARATVDLVHLLNNINIQ